MRYSLSDIVDLAPSQPGLLIPIFQRIGSNLPFVQEMNENFEVVSMIPFMDADNYDLSTEIDRVSTDIGEKGIIAFRSYDTVVRSMTVDEIFRYRDEYRLQLSQDPFLDMQLARICGDPLSVMFDKWASIAPIFASDSAARHWSIGENRLFQKNRSIWRNVKKYSSDVKRDEVFSDNTHSFEYYFRWLNRNYRNISWQSVWVRAFQLDSFDERLIQIGNNWVSSQLNSDNTIQYFRNILYVVLERAGKHLTDDDFRRCLTSYFWDHPEQLYAILYPHDFIYYVMKNLSYDSASEKQDTSALAVVHDIQKIIDDDDRYSSYFFRALQERNVDEEYLLYLDSLTEIDQDN